MTQLALQSARPAFAADGTLFSPAFDDIYHSADGSLDQAQQVFLRGNELPLNWSGKRCFTILENGFGSGLNFLATWAAWRNDPMRPEKLHYLATELHPFQADDLTQLHRNQPELEFLAEALRNAWPLLMPGFHRLEFAAGRVVLTLMLGDAEASLRKLRANVDAFFLDGFAPRKNPEMWSASLLRRCAQLAAPKATFATWCIAKSVREALTAAGFQYEKLLGFGRKHEMLAGRIGGRPKLVLPDAAPTERHALVIGAGLAGCAVAERLAMRGWHVDIFDRHAQPAGEASGNLAGIVRPLLSQDDNLASRLNRACFLHLGRSWQRLDRMSLPPRRNLGGILQIAHDDEHEALQREWLATQGYPTAYVQFLDQDAASRHLGAKTTRGGWWFPAGGWASPPSLCRAWLNAGGGNIHFHGNCEITRVQFVDGRWQLFNAENQQVADSARLIFASGAQFAAMPLDPIAALPITPVRGQVSHLAAGSLPKLTHAACREGYLTPAVNGVHCLGASYAKDFFTEIRASEHTENLLRLSQMLDDFDASFDVESMSGRVGFRATTPDHLPLVGALPDLSINPTGDVRMKTFPRLPGMYGLLGLGSRGLVWTSLLAEHLASQINAEPLPLEGDQVDAIDPARFAFRAYKKRS